MELPILPTKGEQECERPTPADGITDELRTWAKGSTLSSWTAEHLTAIADRIDAKHEEAIQQALMGEGCVPATDENMAELGWVRLPKDADGEYIHIGDVMAYADNTCPRPVVALIPPAVFLTDDGPRYADVCHHAPDTWERIIADAVNVHGNGFNPCWTDERDALVARCRALAGEGA